MVGRGDSSGTGRRWHRRLGGLMAGGLALFGGETGSTASGVEPDLRTLLLNGREAEVVDRLRRDGGPHAELERLGRVLSVTADSAGPVFTRLARDPSSEAALWRAELAWWLARGDEAPRREREQRDFRPVLAATEDIGRWAAPLLEHDDPFVRGLAEWAIAIRVAVENGGSRSLWPTGEGPDWYGRWRQALEKPGFRVECAHVREAVLAGALRSPEALRRSAEAVVHRALAATGDAWLRPSSGPGGRVAGRAQALHDSWVEFQTRCTGDPGDLAAQRRAWLRVRGAARQLILGDPELPLGELLFATRHAYHDGGNITAGAKSYIIKPGGDLWVKRGCDPDSGVRALLAGRLGPGHTRGVSLHWEADRAVFSYVRQPRYFEEPLVESDQGFDDKVHGASEPAHLYEVRLDGTGLRQITDHSHHSDIEPAYLPNGEVIFCSDRSAFGSQCSGSFLQNKRIVNLYRVAVDGTGLRALTQNKDFDRYPSVLADGTVVYTRWEYQERHLWQTHNLWTLRPDGWYGEALYKQHINSGPMSLRDARGIPGSDRLVAIACGHHEFAQGAVVLIDPRGGLNDSAGMRLVTPNISPREGGLGWGGTVEEGGVGDSGGLYQHPYPLSERAFLVAYSDHLPRQDGNARNFALYYIDVWGNQELIHRDPILSIAHPVPVRRLPVPPVLEDHPARTEEPVARCYVADVSRGMPEVSRETIRYLRIVQRTHWPAVATGDGVTEFNHWHYTPSGSWSSTLGVWTWTPARVIGIVPVAADGSAYFEVPAGVPVYFQALDQDYLEVRRMRTFVTLQPGEVRGCTGCHETQDRTPPALTRVPLALGSPAARPVPPFWGDQELPDFERHIQPLLERHCVRCHGAEDPAGGLEYSGRRVDGYLQSYRTMFGLGPRDLTPVDEVGSHRLFHPKAPVPVRNREALRAMERNRFPGQQVSIANRFSDNSVSRPREFGSGRSLLIRSLLDRPEHREGVRWSAEDWIGLVTWVDLNAPYWGSFVDKEPLRRGEPPRRVPLVLPPPFARVTTPSRPEP